MKYPYQKAEDETKKIIQDILAELKCKNEVKLETPPEGLGDFAFPCFSLAPILRKSPNDISKEIANKIKKNKWIDKIETKAGYVNFYINNTLLKKDTFEILFEKKEKYGTLEKKNKKIIVEHTSANPNGPLHVGRARNPIIGDTITRIFKAAGYSVESQFYLDDMGKQVAILAWGVKNLKPADIPKGDYDKADHKTVGFYQKASILLKEDKKVQKELNEIVKKLEEGDEETIKLVHKAYKPVLLGMKESMKKINIEIDSYIPESKFVKDKSVDAVIKKLKKSKHCKKENEALYIDLKPFGITGRNTNFFFLRSDGTTLYATRDIAAAIERYEKYEFEKMIYQVGQEQKLHFQQVFKVLELMGYDWAKNCIHSEHGLYLGKNKKKFSTRKGQTVFMEEILDKTKKLTAREIKKRFPKIKKQELEERALKVAIAAIFYGDLKNNKKNDIVFDLKQFTSFDGNTGPYLLYSYARAGSILKKASRKKINKNFQVHDLEEKELELVKALSQFSETAINACNNMNPSAIANYCYNISQKFNEFYQACPVIDSEYSSFRLALVESFRQILKNALNLLGIEVVEEM